MRKLFFSLFAILAGLGFIGIGNGLLNIAIPSKATQNNFDPLLIGLLTTFYYIGFSAGCFVTPRYVKKVGHIRSFACFTALLCIAALSFSYNSSPWAWFVLRIMSGFAVAGVYMIAESWLNECADNKNRGRIISLYRIVDLVSIMTGQLLLGRFELGSNEVFLVSATLINLGLIPVALTSSPGPRPIEIVKINFERVFEISHIGFVTCGLVGGANAAFYGMAPQFALSKGLSTQLVGVFLAGAVLAGASFQVVVGWLADKMDRERLLYSLALLASIAGACMFLAGSKDATPNELIGLSFLWGAFAMPLYSLAIAIANDRAEPNDFLELSGGLLVSFSIGAVLGPFITPLFIEATGVAGLFFFTASTHLVMAVYVFYRRRFVLSPVPDSERESFASAPRTTPVVFEMDPRAPPSE